jgi:hypothetical protein
MIFETIISGLIIFISSQYILEIVIRPYIDYKQTISEIDNRLKFLGNKINSNYSELGKETYEKIYDEIRNLSCKLETNYKRMPSLLRKTSKLIHISEILHSKEQISQACSELMILANSLGELNRLNPRDGNWHTMMKIRTILELEQL